MRRWCTSIYSMCMAPLRNGFMDDLGRLVVNQIQLINGITRTTTCSVVHL